MQQEPLNPIMVKRAVQLWMRALAAPVYNNLASGEVHLPSMMANAMMTQAPKDNTPEKLAAFGAALESLINTKTVGHDGVYTYYENSLGVDYHECAILSKAAKIADLKMPFPIKTRMYINDDSVSFSMGYAAQEMQHYPLNNGRWLVTDLRGCYDIQKIISAINSGIDMGLTIEPAEFNQEKKA